MKNETAKREIESLDYYLQNHTDDYSEESHTAMMMAIKALEQRWIPVSERLPEVDGRYLTTVKGYNCNKIRSFTNNLYVIDKYEFSGRKAGWYFYDSEYGYIEETDVIAWMPLPEPYKEDAE